MADIKDVFKEFEDCFATYVEKIGFKKTRKKHFTKKVGQCIQFINICDNKIRGQQAIEIRITVGVSYAEVNKKVAELRMKKYESVWPTGSLVLGELSVPPENLRSFLTPECNVQTICEEIFEKIAANVPRFWNKTDSMEKMLAALLSDDKEVCSCTFGLGKPSWTSLAIVCLMDDPTKITEVLMKYEDFFSKNMPDETRMSLKEKYGLGEM